MKTDVESKVLETFHYVLKHNGFEFTDEGLDLADTFIQRFIVNLGIRPEEFKVVTMGAPKLVKDKRIIPLLIQYFAFLENNMDLYTKLFKSDYVFYENYSIKFYALDRLLSGNFTIDEYINLLNNYGGVVSKFYASIRDIDSCEKEKCCRDFAFIVHSDPTVLEVGYNNGEEGSNYNFLTAKNICLFGKEFLLSINSNQREMINSIDFNIREDEALKIKELCTRYPEFLGSISLCSNLLRYFTIDEISNMKMKDSIMYEEAMEYGLLDRMKNILSLNPDFNCQKEFIRVEIFNAFSDEEIIGLTCDAKKEVIGLMIPDGEDTTGTSKLYRKILSHDEKRKRQQGYK